MRRFKLVAIFLFVVSTRAFATEPQAEESYADKAKSLIPNSIAFAITDEQTSVALDGRPTLGTHNEPFNGPFSEYSAITGSISITRSLIESKFRKPFEFSWQPVFTISLRNLAFDSTAAFLDDTDFQMFRTSAGIGPEIAYNQWWGTFYAQLTPGIAYSWVSWSSPVAGGSMAAENLNVALTVGYYYCFNSRWNLRFFLRELSEDTSVWKTALRESQGFDIPVTSVSTAITGFSLGRSFDLF